MTTQSSLLLNSQSSGTQLRAIAVADPLAKTKSLYDSRDWKSVCFYLEAQPQASQELALARSAISAIFQSEHKPRLQVNASPDNDGPSILVAYIPIKTDADDAFRRIEQFDEWCLDNLPMNSAVIFDVEFE